MKRKILAGLLSLCMMVSLVPTAAFAEEATPAEGTPVVCAGVAETECLAEEHIECCDKYVAPAEETPVIPAETPVENESLTAYLIDANGETVGSTKTFIASLAPGAQYSITVILKGNLTSTTQIRLQK